MISPFLDEFIEDHLDPYSGMDYICNVQLVDKDDIAQCQETINFLEKEKYQKLKEYLDPEGVER